MDIGDSRPHLLPDSQYPVRNPGRSAPPAQLLMTMSATAHRSSPTRARCCARVSKFDELGLTICAAFELEFYLIDQENINGQPPRSPISGKRRTRPRSI